MDPKSNEQAAEFIRQKIRAIVQDPGKAELLCPNYPFGSKRPPSGHFYYVTFNRSNVKMVDISGDGIELYENGFRTSSGAEHELDMEIFAPGFNSGSGAERDRYQRQSRQIPQGILDKEAWDIRRNPCLWIAQHVHSLWPSLACRETANNDCLK